MAPAYHHPFGCAKYTITATKGMAQEVRDELARWTNDPENKPLLDAGKQVGQLLLSEGTKRLPD